MYLGGTLKCGDKTSGNYWVESLNNGVASLMMKRCGVQYFNIDMTTDVGKR